MNFELIASRGRVADRTPGATRGSVATLRALEAELGLEGKEVGFPAAVAEDDWSVSLPQAGATLNALRSSVDSALARGSVPLLATNTCAASLATLPAAAGAHPDLVLLWVDAHGDFHTPGTTASGYLGGMVLAAACGMWDSGHGSGIRPDRVVIVGGRDIDQAEDELLREAGVRILPPDRATPDAISDLIGESPVWIHVDWDALEPGHVPAAYSVPGGLLPGQLRALLGALADRPVAGVELAEFEASGNGEGDGEAIEVILETVRPLLA